MEPAASTPVMIAVYVDLELLHEAIVSLWEQKGTLARRMLTNNEHLRCMQDMVPIILAELTRLYVAMRAEDGLVFHQARDELSDIFCEGSSLPLLEGGLPRRAMHHVRRTLMNMRPNPGEEETLPDWYEEVLRRIEDVRHTIQLRRADLFLDDVHDEPRRGSGMT